MDNKEKKKKINKDNWFKTTVGFIKQLRSTPRGRGILFFAFYFVFFLVIAILARVGGTYPAPKYDLSAVRSVANLEKIEANNYNFKYTIVVDNTSYIYLGQKNGDVEKFKFNENEYYRNDGYYINKNNEWTVVENPYVYPEFVIYKNFDINMSTATFISRTEYEQGGSSLNYEITVDSLLKSIDNIVSDLDLEVNKFNIYSGEDGFAYRIEADLSSYGKYKKICNNTFKINLEYSDFGQVTDIKK